MIPTRELLEAVDEKKLIVLLGAGVSAAMVPGAPTWSELTEKMIEHFRNADLNIPADAATKKLESTSDFKYALQALECADPGQFQAGLLSVLAPAMSPIGNKLGFAQILTMIQSPLIITLSWDRLLEKTGDYQILTWKDVNNDRLTLENKFHQHINTLLHLHGSVTRPDTVLATLKSYSNLYILSEQGPPDDIEASVTGFKEDVEPNGLKELFESPDNHVLVLGVNPSGSEFNAILTVLLKDKTQSANFHIVCPKNEAELFSSTLKNNPILASLRNNFTRYAYPIGEHGEVIDFVARLGRNSISLEDSLAVENWEPVYRTYLNEQRASYLNDQCVLESKAGEIWYATEYFTNVFGDDEFLEKKAINAAGAAFPEGPSAKDIGAIECAMKLRRDTVITGLKSGQLSHVRCLYWKEDEASLLRVIKAKALFSRYNATLDVKWIDIDTYSEQDIQTNVLKPSFALIFGAATAPFRVGIAHAHQATEGYDANFQWLHINTIFSAERTAWFNRAWQSACRI